MQVSLSRLPNEPGEKEDQKRVTRIRFRLPNGEMLQRKFLIENSLEALFDFLTSNGYFVEEFKVLSSWPRYIFYFKEVCILMSNINVISKAGFNK